MSTLGDVDLVTIGDIADAAKVRPDTVKKWADRNPDTFPKPRENRVRGARVWVWGDVRRWLEDSGRLPRTLRYQWNGLLEAQTLDGDDRWRTVALFVPGPDDDGDYSAMPGPYIWDQLIGPKPAPTGDEEADEAAGAEWVAQREAHRAEAQQWADRMLEGWDKARAAWVRDHPDESMPAHLIGARNPDEDERVLEQERGQVAELAAVPEADALRAERARLLGRVAEIDAQLPEPNEGPSNG